MTTIRTRLSKKLPSYGGRLSEEDDPSLSAEDEEVDETFLALQKLLKALNRNSRSSNNSSSSSFLGGNSLSQVTPINDNQQRMSREEMLESRRQERDRFRRSLFARNGQTNARGRRRRTCPIYYCSEEEEEEETTVPSVESTISNRFMNGTFSNLNVHVISRNRWANEDHVIERLPIVMLPKSGKYSIPTDNEKIKVVQTDEFIDLREKLVESLPPGASPMHYLTPPRSTWYMQMHDFENHKY